MATECTGITHISEDSSEIAFLLVENYQQTVSSAINQPPDAATDFLQALVGLRIGKEFLKLLRDLLRPFHQLYMLRASTWRRAHFGRRD
ncbi:hypothetical protein CLAFUW4_01195 [Fulvia fulva]|uniref:Uncharacterized protein n=1 Tax=Passalora fulva TaxID=5499 RepID=A0A9Q8L7Z6_PASFU|nr:uncharacterized protein CLAFUR5_01200 [Fulvia fulva]KAK4634122.1 hypothetical protein CLAFUR4_01196 [Fulvia fulva]KAK4638584.1 hypothetical protein CLAFUR0_01197 [Fulvia fulva]UJO12532.1 hypothetical protein CLAFUR5_01200 [Fulvia fulva]WPV09050.1 hypothetical protein CLAFUW4_01195 [Fulvia fulva]WPV23566.1 hypothetical protein CLAFUW7_01200 [Fulvia fulva]